MTDITAKKWGIDSAWLSSPRYDLTLILGVLFLALASGAVVWVKPELFGPILFLDLWLLGYHHVIATFTKLAGTPQDRAENKFLIYQLPFIVLGVVALLASQIGVWTVVTIYFFWQWYHYTRQAYGIAAFYRRKAQNPPAENQYLSQATLWTIPTWGLLNRCNQGWDKFLGLDIWLPPVPDFVVAAAGLAALYLFGIWCFQRIAAWRAGTLPLGHTLFMLSHFTAFFVGYVLIPDINIGWLVANIWHNAQYILFVWLYNTNRFKKPVEGAKWLSWASQPQPMRILAYFGGCLILTTIFYKSIQGILYMSVAGNEVLLATLYIVAFQTLNFHHYVVDSYIWKARKKQNQKIMNLKPD